MMAGDNGERDAINNRMASEFERVAVELGKFERRSADLSAGGESSFSPNELSALQMLLEQGTIPASSDEHGNSTAARRGATVCL